MGGGHRRWSENQRDTVHAAVGGFVRGQWEVSAQLEGAGQGSREGRG